MNRFLVILILLFSALIVHAQENQSKREVIQITQFLSGELSGVQNTNTGIRSTGSKEVAEYVRYNIEMPLEEVSSFIAFAIVWDAQFWDPEKDALWIRFKGGLEDATWQKMEVDPHSQKGNDRHISKLTFVDKYVDKIDFKIIFEEESKAIVRNLDLHFFNPRETRRKGRAFSNEAITRDACICPQPNFEDRADWCPAGDCPPHPNPSATAVSHMIIHHSAGANTSSNWAGVVQSIWDYHVNVNGWSDIGYNWLIDPNGVLYEGRGDNVLGAHFCGTNTNTMGVCVMGDYTSTTPTTDTKTTLKNLLAWKTCDVEVDPESSAFHAASGINLHHISGHQDGCATACPGASFYPEIPGIRTEVKTQIENTCENTLLGAPTNLEAEVLSSNSIKLTWQDNASSENIFIVERSIMSNNNYEIIGSTNLNQTVYIDEDLEANTAYFYQVKTANAQDTSIYSNQVGIATVMTTTKGMEELAISVYPNPVQDFLSIEFPEGEGFTYEINIFEMATSKYVSDFVIGINEKIDLSDLAKGVYLLQVTDGKKQGYAKLVKN